MREPPRRVRRRERRARGTRSPTGRADTGFASTHGTRPFNGEAVVRARQRVRREAPRRRVPGPRFPGFDGALPLGVEGVVLAALHPRPGRWVAGVVVVGEVVVNVVELEVGEEARNAAVPGPVRVPDEAVDHVLRERDDPE